MGAIELLAISLGLSMDAFSAAICKGTTIKKSSDIVAAALILGIFQGIMPLLGYCLGNFYAADIEQYANIIGFVLLSVLGVKMIIEARSENDDKNGTDGSNLFVLAVATSIDAMAVGLIFASCGINPLLPSLSISTVTFTMSLIGGNIGRYCGTAYGKAAETAGGVILLLIGIKMLV